MRRRLTRYFKGLPITGKLRLMITVTSGLSLCLACAGFLTYEFVTFRREAVARISSVAEIVARNSRAAMSFHDVEAAERTLSALAVEEEVSLACVFTVPGLTFAEYHSSRDSRLPGCRFQRPRPPGHAFEDRALLLTVPIVLDGEAIGSLFLRYEMNEAYERALRYGGIVAAVLAASLVLAFLISERLQVLISRPVAHLVEVARRVSRERNYALRATKYADDELGVLIDSFNEMLGKIAEHDQVVARHRETLEQQVAERTRTLAAQNQNLRREIDARRRAEKGLRASERDMRMLMEQASDGIAIMDARGEIRAMNRAGCEMLGYAPEQVSGLRFSELFPPEAVGSGGSLFDSLRGDRALLQERRLQRRDGSLLWTEISMKRLDDGRIQAIIRDVTERKQLEARLQHAQKMEAVGQLAAGVAHEINNPMAFVRSNLATLRKEWDGFSRELEQHGVEAERRQAFAECGELIDESLDGVNRVVSIVRDVKGFTHQGEYERTLVDVREVLAGVLRLAATHLGPGKRVVRHYEAVPLVSCVVEQIRQVFLNLIVNASDAVGERGTVEIHVRHRECWVEIAIEDDGCGVAPEIAGRLFDPFFTTKPVGKGTGLGLAISYDIVRRHGGTITFESEPGQGSVFRVCLPVEGQGSGV